MPNVLAEKMFTNYNSQLLEQHTVNQHCFVFIECSSSYCLVVQPDC